MLDIVVRSKGLIGIVVAAEVDIVVGVVEVFDKVVDIDWMLVGTMEKIVAGIGSRVL